jgi:hypothetical protein
MEVRGLSPAAAMISVLYACDRNRADPSLRLGLSI